MRKIHKSAWLLVLLSSLLQILIFPLPNLYVLSWVALAPLVVAILRTRQPDAIQLLGGTRWLAATPWQAFLLSYGSGILWYAGTCYWIFNTMRQYGGVSAPAAVGLLLLFCMYVALYHALFGVWISLLAGPRPFRWALLLTPFVWVASELARTRITGFPWDLLGNVQVDNIPLARIATVTGVYGLSFEIMVVNAALAAAFVVPRQKRKPLLWAAIGAAVVLQAGILIPAPAAPADHAAYLVQENVPILAGSDWTKEYFDGTIRDLSWISLNPPASDKADSLPKPNLIVWPESPAPFYTSDPTFREAVSNVAREGQAWVIAGSLGTRPVKPGEGPNSDIFNSAAFVSPSGEWISRYDKIHLVPFGEYVPFRSIFGFAGGLTKEVGDFSRGTSRAPLDAGGTKLGVFICYESIFPDEIRQLAQGGAEVLVNTSNDGWYGDSGAYAQHLKHARMRAVENSRWVLRATNTGVTASIDPFGRIQASIPRKVRATLKAPFALSEGTTFYTRHGDWFAYLCAIISVAALLARFLFRPRTEP